MYCKYCNTEKPDEDFETFVYKGKKSYTRKKCKRCKQDTQNERVRNNRKWLNHYKSKLECSKCGIKDERVLEFHHLYGKDNNIANMMGYSKTRIIEEISKCVVVCANCHRIIHS